MRLHGGPGSSSRTVPCGGNRICPKLQTSTMFCQRCEPEVIYHLAGSVGASPDRQLVLPTFHSLLLSTINLLSVATELGCRRIILAGSLTEPRPQDAVPVPSSPYAAAKWAAGGYGQMFHALYETPIVVLIPFMTFGPGQDQTKLIPSVILSALRGESPQLASGRWEADWVYVDDVIEGFLTAAHAPDIDGRTIDLGSGIGDFSANCCRTPRAGNGSPAHACLWSAS